MMRTWDALALLASALVLSACPACVTGGSQGDPRSRGPAVPHALNYDDMVPLDAEQLAEVGIKAAYERLLPSLRKHVPSPAALVERIDADAPSYVVICLGTDYRIYDANERDEAEAWGKATFALFHIVNRQLATTPYRFYALNGGNDLGGMFLTPDQAEAARRALPNRSDWPYLPVANEPWYGQQH